MGWSSAAGIMASLIKVTKDAVPDKDTRKRIYDAIYGELVAGDWDTEGDCVGMDPAYDELYKEKKDEEWGPGWDDE